jgi:hypothetical protein
MDNPCNEVDMDFFLTPQLQSQLAMVNSTSWGLTLAQWDEAQRIAHLIYEVSKRKQ